MVYTYIEGTQIYYRAVDTSSLSDLTETWRELFFYGLESYSERCRGKNSKKKFSTNVKMSHPNTLQSLFED